MARALSFIIKGKDEKGEYYIITDDLQNFVAQTRCEFTANKIVRACNAHDDLVAALQKALAVVSDRAEGGKPVVTKEYASKLFDEAKSVLAKAKAVQ